MKSILAACLACALVTAGLGAGAGGALAKSKGKAAKSHKVDKPLTAAEQAAVASGALTAKDAQLNCKRMAGRMQIRILELRGGGVQHKGSGAAQGMQSVLTPIFGGTKRGADAPGDRTRDLAALKAMNEILISRNCPRYDLDGELAKGQDAPTPRLIRSKTGPGKTMTGKAKAAKGARR